MCRVTRIPPRTKAEVPLAAQASIVDPGARSAEDLLQDLQLHQTELEMQAEALRAAQVELEEARDHYEELYEFAPIGYLTLTPACQVAAINLTGAVLLGYERSKIVNFRFSRVITPSHQDRWYRQFVRVMKQAEVEPLEIDLELVRADGSTFYGHLNGVRVEGAHQGRLLRIAISDISQSRREELQLRIAAVAFQSQESIIITDSTQRILRVNQAFTKMTGYTEEEAIGQYPPRLLHYGRQDEAFFRRMTDTILKQGAWHGEVWHRHKDGSEFQISLNITAVKDDAGIITNFVATSTDITFRKRAEEQIENLAFHDQLTQLPNRRLLFDRLKHALDVSARNRQFGALLFIDLDNFKTINDTQGHEVGDILLKQVAARLRECVRASDTVARLGGDEFVVMLEGLGSKFSDASNEAQALCSKILKTLHAPFQIGSFPYVNTASIGIACFSGDRFDTVDEILRQADIAMYQAKSDGRNIFRVFDSGMQTRVSQRATLEANLQTALSADQFRLFYQPEVTASGQVYAAEALLRWQHPTRGLVQPAEFISIAEETGLILPLGSWVLDRACAQLAHWATLPLMKALILSINVSARQFHYPDFVDQIRAAVESHGANPNLLKLELTESLLLKDVEGTIAKLKTLRSYGVHFSLDDFGTGYSSLSYLRRLPLDQLKIDQSFVRDIPGDTNACSVVCTILSLGHTLGLRVIAEGVETQEQRDFLADNGCDFFQGYLFGHPAPSDDFTAFVTANAQR